MPNKTTVGGRRVALAAKAYNKKLKVARRAKRDRREANAAAVAEARAFGNRAARRAAAAETAAILADPETMAALAEADADILAGDVVPA